MSSTRAEGPDGRFRVAWPLVPALPGRRIATIAIVAGTYLVAAKFCFRLASVNPSVTPVWLPTGIAIATILLIGYRGWPGIFLGAFLANVTTAGTMWTSLGIATGNTLEALVAAYLVNRYADGVDAFDHPNTLFRFALLAAVGSTMVSATIGVTTLALARFAPWTDYGAVWFTWWLGDATGALIVTPLVLLWSRRPPTRWYPREVLQRIAFLAVLAVVAGIVLSGLVPYPFLLAPLLVWAAFRFAPWEAMAALFLLGGIAIWETTMGHGPFARATSNASLLELQAFLAAMVLVTLPLASAVAERQAADRDRRRHEGAQRLLAEAGMALGTSLDPDETLKAVARLMVPALADWCTVDVLTSEGRLQTLARVDHDPANAEVSGDLSIRDAAGTVSVVPGVHETIRDGRSQIYPDLRAHPSATVGDAPPRQIVRDLYPRSAMIVPLTARDRILGALTLVSTSSARRRYDQADLVLAEEIARRAAIAVDNARLHQIVEEQRLAAEQAQQRAEQAAVRAERLQAVTAALSQALTPTQVADVILTEGNRVLHAAAAVVYELREEDASLEMLKSVGYPEPLVSVWSRILGSAESPAAEAARTGQPVYYESIAAVLRRYPALHGKMNPYQGRRTFHPLLVGGRPTGALGFIFEEATEFETDERIFIAALAYQCAQALERSGFYAREHRVVEALQHAFLPVGLPQIPGIEIDTAYLPGARDSKLGGDWYDVFHLSDGRVALSIGDVVGRGLDAAAMMGQIRQTIRAVALSGHEPSAVLEHASRVLNLTHEADGMATAIFGVLDPVTRTFEYSVAGHPAPVVAPPDGPARALPAGGVPLGFVSTDELTSQRVVLSPGTLLTLYTDGLTEFAHDAPAGEHALFLAAEELQRSGDAGPAHALLRRVLGDTVGADDTAIITVHVADHALDRLDLLLPARPSTLRLVRQAVRQLTTALSLDSRSAASLNVAVGEAVNNVIEHAYGATPGTVSLHAERDGDMLHIEIKDHGRWRPERQDETGGRGLILMRELVDAVEVRSTPAGTVTRLSIALPSEASAVETDAPGRVETGAASPVRGGPQATRSAIHSEAAAEPIPPAAQLELQRVSGVPVVSVVGDLDLTNIDRFASLLERAASGNEKTVVLSLAEATYLDSHALRVILQIGRRILTSRRRLVLVIPPACSVRRILDAVGLHGVFPVQHSVEAAIAATTD